MTKGFRYDPTTHVLEVVNGSRKVLVGAGTMVSLLTTMSTFTGRTATYPDFSKGNLYIWTSEAKVVIDTIGRGESAYSFITALPQEYSAITELESAPAGANIFWGQLKLSRTTAPADAWMGRTLSVLPIQNEWMNINGAFSCLLEADVNMSRALHVYIDENPLSSHYRKLVMEVEQTVGPAVGGYVSSTTSGDGFNYVDGYEAVNASNTTTGSGNGTPVKQRAASSYGYESAAWGGGPLAGPGIPPTFLRHDGAGHGAASIPSRVDNSNYQSVYSVTIRGRYGRRG